MGDNIETDLKKCTVVLNLNSCSRGQGSELTELFGFNNKSRDLIICHVIHYEKLFDTFRLHTFFQLHIVRLVSQQCT
jgi:hypothetical protein